MTKFPEHCTSTGRRVEYLSKVLLPTKNTTAYIELMDQLLGANVHYVDSVHEYRSKGDVLAMLSKYLPRVANEKFQFELIHDGEEDIVWCWTIYLKIRLTPFEFVIHGLVHARIKDGAIVYQREYYDPMESIGIIPVVGWLYKLMLRLG